MLVLLVGARLCAVDEPLRRDLRPPRRLRRDEVGVETEPVVFFQRQRPPEEGVLFRRRGIDEGGGIAERRRGGAKRIEAELPALLVAEKREKPTVRSAVRGAVHLLGQPGVAVLAGERRVLVDRDRVRRVDPHPADDERLDEGVDPVLRWPRGCVRDAARPEDEQRIERGRRGGDLRERAVRLERPTLDVRDLVTAIRRRREERIEQCEHAGQIDALRTAAGRGEELPGLRDVTGDERDEPARALRPRRGAHLLEKRIRARHVAGKRENHGDERARLLDERLRREIDHGGTESPEGHEGELRGLLHVDVDRERREEREPRARRLEPEDLDEAERPR